MMYRERSKRLPQSVFAFQESIRKHVRYTLGKNWQGLSNRDLFLAVAHTVRDHAVDKMLDTEQRYQDSDAKRMYYLSMQFLMGRSLGNNLYNLGLLNLCRKTLLDMGVDLEEVRDEEPDAALGNGGPGRLAACFLDSLATLGMPGYGYGINYEYGLFKQEIRDGYQKEKPDNWLTGSAPWQIERPDEACIIPLYGKIEHAADRTGDYNPVWKDWKVLIGVPHDMPVVGYGGRAVNFLRLYSARSSQEFDMEVFNTSDYIRAVEQKIADETVSKILYPSDLVKSGRELRLAQEYFLVACAVRDMVRRYQKKHDSFDRFPYKVAIQINDTHPALAVAELMRVFVDENHLSWEDAWEITRATVAYTNHTLLPEALEKWPVSLFEYVLPRHLQIIYEIDSRFQKQVAHKWPGDENRWRRMAIVERGDEKHLRMAHLAIVGSHSVNGVAALHSELVKTSLASDFYKLWPEKFNNKTNGVTPRRWLLKSNPLLAELITNSIGDEWITDLDRLRNLEAYADDKDFQAEFMKIKRANKEKLARIIEDTTRVEVNTSSLFDVQVTRIHEYKRQLLNVFHIIHQYFRLIEDDQGMMPPRAYIFAGKAAPGYREAKQIIKLINNVADTINNDPRVRESLKVVFIPDYRVSLAEKIFPAADLSQQISTAGMEASGTGNMKFALNGALTIGALNGANIEIQQEVGAENLFIFGLKDVEIEKMRREGSYNPRELYNSNPYMRRVLDSLKSNMFCPREPGLFKWIYESVVEDGDKYFHLADMPSYIQAQMAVDREFNNPGKWARKAVLNVARMGKFSSDRAVSEYAKEIWGIVPVL